MSMFGRRCLARPASQSTSVNLAGTPAAVIRLAKSPSAPGADYRSVNYGWFSARYDDFVYLDRVAIAADHRGHGIGSRLYDEVERRTRAGWFTLEVNPPPAQRRLVAFPRPEGVRGGGAAGYGLRRPGQLDGEAPPMMPRKAASTAPPSRPADEEPAEWLLSRRIEDWTRPWDLFFWQTPRFAHASEDRFRQLYEDRPTVRVKPAERLLDVIGRHRRASRGRPFRTAPDVEENTRA